VMVTILLIPRSVFAQTLARNALSYSQCSHNRLRFTLNNPKQRLGSTGRCALALLPFSQCRGADAKGIGKLILGKTQLLACPLNIVRIDGHLMHATAGSLALRMGQRLRHRLHEFITQLTHLRFLTVLIAVAKAVTVFRCSAVKSARSFLP